MSQEQKAEDNKDEKLQNFIAQSTDVKKGVKVKFPKLQQPLILGFAYSIAEADAGTIHLSSIQKDRNISVIQLRENNGYKHLKFPDPYRDCNKLYMAMGGFPTNTKMEQDMEDFGVNDKIKEQYAKCNKDKDEDNKEETLECIGDWWIDKDHPMEDKTRLLFFVKTDIQSDDTKWVTIVVKRRDLTDFTIKSIIFKLAESFEITQSGTIIIPVVQPIKYLVKTETKEGYVYIG
eukprot:CAMPEP_0201575680 /NCGR_PEP_ID=MMETSP0190_2-20130828/21041_1 /ASSEMBLY_ACC=CAM_ASM_000263 /TAXON_ID=37353 /ORGANISM="Rosalina sp." /LENGTH=232 /DNA_ID=CAMNT_0048005619 /DNA_START=83 /DNA_END=781 /DNA_ORIENTATION=-